MSATVAAAWDANTADRYGIPAACNAQGDWGKDGRDEDDEMPLMR